MPYTTQDFLNSVKRKVFFPISQSTFQDADLLAIADEELQTAIVPALLRDREEFFVVEQITSLVAGQGDYSIPSRAIGLSLRDVVYLDASGTKWSLAKIDYDSIPRTWAVTQQGQPLYFYLKSNLVSLLPVPSSGTGSLLLAYFTRPNSLVATSAAGQVTAFDPLTNTVTLNNLPTTFSAGVLCDFVKQDGGSECLATDAVITTAANNLVTFTTALPSTLRIGDWVCLSTETTIPQIPTELRPVLVQRTIVKVLEALGDVTALQQAQQKLTEMEKSVLTLMSPRVEGEFKKVLPIWRRSS